VIKRNVDAGFARILVGDANEGAAEIDADMRQPVSLASSIAR
jgi:hypothetical protein